MQAFVICSSFARWLGAVSMMRCRAKGGVHRTVQSFIASVSPSLWLRNILAL
jgi:hypothetical protein